MVKTDKNLYSIHKLTLSVLITYSSMISIAYAQFDQLFKDLQRAFPQQMNKGSDVTKSKNAMNPNDEWCSGVTGALGNRKVDKLQVKVLIASEFNFPNEDVIQEEFYKAFRRQGLSRTFPGVDFFSNNFETKLVNGIYRTFLSFPEPDTLAVLIHLTKSNDRQERGDALMALAFLHLQAPQFSNLKDRWRELHKEALKNPHITGLVFRARINAYGEFAPKNINYAVNDLNQAASLETEYRNSGSRFEFDTSNYMLAQKYTLNDLLRDEPNFPNRKMYESMGGLVKQIEDAQAMYARHFPNTRIGKMAKEINKINQETMNYGTELIRRSQGGNQLVGQLASLESLKSRTDGDKPVFVASNPELESATIKMMSMVGTLDAEQKKLLTAAQEKRYTAQGLTYQAQLEVFNQIMQGFSRGGLAGATAPIEAVKQFDTAMVQSCALTAKWEQAMRAKDVPPVDMKKPASEVGMLSSKYQND